MFCPFCGVKNNLEQPACFVCSRRLPSLDETPVPRRLTAGRPPAPATALARMRERLLALSLDLGFVAAALLVCGAALWSEFEVVRHVDPTAVAATSATAAALFIFLYNWVAEEAFGATLGKALAGVRVVRRERPLSLGARAGVIGLWVSGVAAAVWGAAVLCPQWFTR